MRPAQREKGKSDRVEKKKHSETRRSDEMTVIKNEKHCDWARLRQKKRGKGKT